MEKRILRLFFIFLLLRFSNFCSTCRFVGFILSSSSESHLCYFLCLSHPMREFKMEAAEEDEEDNKNKSPPLDGCKKFPENCFFNRLPAKIPIPRRRRAASTTSNNRQRPFRTLVIDRCDVCRNESYAQQYSSSSLSSHGKSAAAAAPPATPRTFVLENVCARESFTQRRLVLWMMMMMTVHANYSASASSTISSRRGLSSMDRA